MGDFIFDQLSFIRQLLLNNVKEVSESQADIIPEGFNNNIRWNLGHVFLVNEQLAFHFAQEPMHIPDGFLQWFGMGSKPSDWTTQPPTVTELVELLQEQPTRIKERLTNRLDETVAHPFTMGSLTLKTIGELLTINLSHESGHAQTIKMYKKLVEQAM